MHEDRVVTNASSVLTAPLATLTTVPASGRRREWPAGPKSSNYRLCHFLPPSWVLASDTHSALCPQQGCKQSHPTVGAGPTWLSALLHSDHGGWLPHAGLLPAPLLHAQPSRKACEDAFLAETGCPSSWERCSPTLPSRLHRGPTAESSCDLEMVLIGQHPK